MKRTMLTVFELTVWGLFFVANLGSTPLPVIQQKQAVLPEGKYILGGQKETARGDDGLKLDKPFRLSKKQYILSGGPNVTDPIEVDDDLAIFQGEKSLFLDDDGVRSTDGRGKNSAPGSGYYDGYPIVLVLDPSKPIRLQATDRCVTDAILGPIWIHRWDGARKKLTGGKKGKSAEVLPHVFFDEKFSIADGFELPANVKYEGGIELPENPASLLPRFKQ